MSQEINSPNTNDSSIIINADDFGLSTEVNTAIVDLLKAGRIQRTTLLVNMPTTREACEMAISNNMLDSLGLHINLTDGSPLTEGIKDTRFCNLGIFNKEEVEKGTRLHITLKEKKAVRKEIQAQFDRFKDLIGHYPKHVDSHRHIHNYLPFLFILMRIAKRCGVESMRIGINLFDKKDASFAKKAYKFVLNSIIASRFNHTDYMGSYLEYVDFYDDYQKKSCEIMVHPTYYQRRIVDIVYDKGDKMYNDFSNIR